MITAPDTAPNVLFMICDDLAFGDLACHGNPHVRTPNIDALSGGGVNLRRYLSGPLCTPARTAIMTGRHPYRTRAIDTYIGRSMIDPDEVTLAQLLKRSGYSTGLFGKWHLGDCYPMRPQDLGFDKVVMHTGGGLRQPANSNEGSYFDPELVHDGKQERFEGYCSDIFANQAIAFISACCGVPQPQPFFAYLAFNAPHTPLEIDERYVEPYRKKGLSESVSRLYGMVENIDENVGRVLAALDAQGVSQNTVVIFTSDHGPCGSVQDHEGKPRFNCGLRGRKGTMFEGGIRVPCLVRWPKAYTGDRRVDRLCNAIDWLPTLSEVCGYELPSDRKIDGESFAPELLGHEPRETSSKRVVCMQWHRGNEPVKHRNYASIGSRYKLLRHAEDGPDELYDLDSDPGELSDIASSHPAIVSRLRSHYEEWFADVSSTRPDNYAPPPIIIGAEEGDPVLLTWQDWLLYDGGEGWSYDKPGYWEVAFAHAGTYSLQVDFVPCQVASCLVVRCGELEQRIPVSAKKGMGNLSGQQTCAITIGPIPEGRAQVHAYLEAQSERIGVVRVRAKAT